MNRKIHNFHKFYFDSATLNNVCIINRTKKVIECHYESD